MQLGTFAFTLFCLPETLYSRNAIAHAEYRPKSFSDLLLCKRGRLHDRQLHWRDFLKPFYMLKYISIVIPGLYYMTCFGYGTVLFASTGASLFSKFYHFNVAQTGLMLSIPLLIGCLIGEFNAGWVTDWMVYRHAKRNDGRQKPEARLNAIWLALLLPVGVVIEGVCLTHYKTASWVGAAFGMGIACLGLQVATTVIYAYTTDVSTFTFRFVLKNLTNTSATNRKVPKFQPFSTHSGRSSQQLYLSTRKSTWPTNSTSPLHHMVGSNFLPSIPLSEKIEIEYAWLVFALINVTFLFPMLALRIYGQKWRGLAWQRLPRFHNDI